MKKQLQITLLSLVSITAFSQTTINGSDVNPSIGESYTSNTCAYQNPGAAGANQTWDFSNLVSTGTYSYNIAASSLNGSNMAFITSGGGSANSHAKIDASGHEQLVIITTNSTFTYSDGEMMKQYPLAYNNTYNDTFKASFVANNIPSTRTGTNTLTVDGYGTLILPGQTISDVIRYKFEETYIDSLDLGGGNYYEINYSSENYYWYKAGNKESILAFSSLIVPGQTVESGFYTALTNVGIYQIDGIDEISILGNPFISDLNFSISTKKDIEIYYELVDLSGSIVYSSNQANLSPGVNTLKLSTENLAKGVYALKIRKGENTMTKLVIKK